MSCVVLLKAILSHSATIFTGVFWLMVNMIDAVNEVTNVSVAVEASELLVNPCTYGQSVVLVELLASLHWCFKFLT